jgi:hypothetical protein
LLEAKHSGFRRKNHGRLHTGLSLIILILRRAQIAMLIDLHIGRISGDRGEGYTTYKHNMSLCDEYRRIVRIAARISGNSKHLLAISTSPALFPILDPTI